MHTEHETCYHCGSATGKAGQGDGSIFDALGIGPYCEKCWQELADGINAALTARIAALEAERKKLWGLVEEVARVQPRCLAIIKENGFVFDKLGAEPGDWQHLAFTLYSEVCAMDTAARALLDASAQGETEKGGG